MAILNNQANVTYTYTGARAPETRISNVANTTLIEDYSFLISKQALQTGYVPGENITFIVTITNDGVNPLTNFTITDDLGRGTGTASPLTYILSSARLIVNDTTTTINPTSTDPLTFTIPTTLDSGDSLNIVYVAEVNDTVTQDVDTITNTVSASATSTTGTNPVTETTSNTISRVNDASLVIIKQSNQSVINSGDNLDYTITISNQGALPATDVVVTDTLPDGFTVNSISISQNGTTYNYAPSEYTINPATNTLTLPNASGRPITIDGFIAGVDNSAVITVSGTFVTP